MRVSCSLDLAWPYVLAFARSALPPVMIHHRRASQYSELHCKLDYTPIAQLSSAPSGCAQEVLMVRYSPCIAISSLFFFAPVDRSSVGLRHFLSFLGQRILQPNCDHGTSCIDCLIIPPFARALKRRRMAFTIIEVYNWVSPVSLPARGA